MNFLSRKAESFRTKKSGENTGILFKIFTAIKQKLRQFLVSLHRPMPRVSTGAGKKHLKKTDYQKNENDN
jgi:hypothetical protein